MALQRGCDHDTYVVFVIRHGWRWELVVLLRGSSLGCQTDGATELLSQCGPLALARCRFTGAFGRAWRSVIV